VGSARPPGPAARRLGELSGQRESDARPGARGVTAVEEHRGLDRLRDREPTLRPKEFELLAVLARHANSAVSRETLMAQVWDENWFGPTKTLDVTMASLRRRLAEAEAAATAPVHVPRIITLHGHGYRLET
jgi:DNA-binding response OmpR family regulator